ncbi:MAG: Uma2 family endonuclease, partial [Chloroflexia bacterium]|nr:Uma2 family endonuclease [Chloroflexia bacterium]
RATVAGRVYTHPVDLILGHNDIVHPDLVVILASRLSIYTDDGFIEEPPDVLIEVISPRTRGLDRVRKMALYIRSRVPEYWVADPFRRELVVNVLKGEKYVPIEVDANGVIASPAISGLRVDPAEVFARFD